MLNEHEFHQKAEKTLEDLEVRLGPIAEKHEFDVEFGGGMLTLNFEEPTPAKFILSPNSPARQIWVSALSTSYKFDWDAAAGCFVLDKNRELFLTVMAELLKKQLGVDVKL